jgi:hypothetical protein
VTDETGFEFIVAATGIAYNKHANRRPVVVGRHAEYPKMTDILSDRYMQPAAVSNKVKGLVLVWLPVF